MQNYTILFFSTAPVSYLTFSLPAKVHTLSVLHNLTSLYPSLSFIFVYSTILEGAMENLTKDVGSLLWIFTSLVFGIIASIVAAYLKPFIDKKWSNYSIKIGRKLEEKSEKEKQFWDQIRNSEIKQLIFLNTISMELRTTIFGIFVLFILLFLITYLKIKYSSYSDILFIALIMVVILVLGFTYDFLKWQLKWDNLKKIIFVKKSKEWTQKIGTKENS